MSINVELAYYANLDTSNATIADSPFLKKLHVRVGMLEEESVEAQESEKLYGFDSDVLDWMKKQDDETQQQVNDIMRSIMVMRQLRPLR